MNALTDLRAPSPYVMCPSCDCGRIVTSSRGGNDPDPSTRRCQDCDGTGAVTGDLALACKIESAAYVLVDLLLQAKKLGRNAAEWESTAKCVRSMLDSCDVMLDEDLASGLLYVLRQERGV